MEIDIRCEECGEYLEIVKEWTDRNGINITVNPCDEKEVAEALSDKRMELLKAAPVTQPYMRASDIDQWFDDYDEWRARVAEAIDE